MGLDMYAYSAAHEKQREKFYSTAYMNPDSGEWISDSVSQPKQLAYWRKHPSLHGWMEQLWIKKGQPDDPGETGWGSGFNGIELELTWQDLDDLERAVIHGQLPHTQGFFFGNSADDYYREQDLEFIRQARADLFLGLRVFYNSSW